MILEKLAGRYLRPEVARFVAACCLGFAGAVAAAFFVAHQRGAPPALAALFGGDYPQFFMIGRLQREHGLSKLYDLDLQDEVLHRVVPSFPPSLHLPFVYPPFVALGFRPLSHLPFAGSYACWMATSVLAYSTALALAFRSSPALPRGDRATAWLLALSFEPFAFECCVGGQLSAVGCLGAALAWTCRCAGRRGLAGLALAALAYKPPLLVLILPMLVAGREWRMLAGFAGGMTVLGLASLASAGIRPCLDFVGLMAGYGRVGGSSGSIWNTRKYVDIGAAMKLLGVASLVARPIALLMALPAIAMLGIAWHRAARAGREARDLAWAATLCWTSVFNVYGPIYDATVAVPGLIVAADAIRRRESANWPMGFALNLAFLYAAALISPALALIAHLQPLTIALFSLGLYLVRASWDATPRGVAIAS